MDGIDVCGQPACRLRFSDRDDVPRFEAAEQVHAVGIPDCLPGLGENIVRERVIADRVVMVDVDRSISRGAELLESRYADLLRRDAHPDITRAKHVFPTEEPHVFGVETIRNVVPLDQDSAVKSLWVRGPAHNDAGLIRMIAVDDAACHLRWGVVPVCCPLYEEFLFDIAVYREIVIRREKDVIVSGITRDARRGDRSGYHRVGYFCSRGESGND